MPTSSETGAAQQEKGGVMRIWIAGIVVALAGCAGMPGQYEPPRYDHSQEAVVADGYPIASIPTPAGFQFAETDQGADARDHVTPGTHSSARVRQNSFAWSSEEENTAVMTALYETLDQNSFFVEQKRSDGYEFFGGRRVQHLFGHGRYEDVAGDASIIPDGAPDCAMQVNLLAVSPGGRDRVVGVFAEGMPCEQMGSITERDREESLERAYQAFGLR